MYRARAPCPQDLAGSAAAPAQPSEFCGAALCWTGAGTSRQQLERGQGGAPEPGESRTQCAPDPRLPDLSPTTALLFPCLGGRVDTREIQTSFPRFTQDTLGSWLASLTSTSSSCLASLREELEGKRETQPAGRYSQILKVQGSSYPNCCISPH